MHALSRTPGVWLHPLRANRPPGCSAGSPSTVFWDLSGLDMVTMRAIGTAQVFALQDTWLLSHVLHGGLRQAMTGAWLLLCAWALWPGLRMPRRERGLVVALVALSLLAVNLVKNTSLTSCPWDLQAFGGPARSVSHWAWGVAMVARGAAFRAVMRPAVLRSSRCACRGWMRPAGVASRRRVIGLRWLTGVLGIGPARGCGADPARRTLSQPHALDAADLRRRVAGGLAACAALAGCTGHATPRAPGACSGASAPSAPPGGQHPGGAAPAARAHGRQRSRCCGCRGSGCRGGRSSAFRRRRPGPMWGGRPAF